MSVSKITGIYHADGGFLGELRYVAGKLRGTAHCALCDVTHGLTGKRSEFTRCEIGLGVPLELVHLNERSAELASFSSGRTPCVVGHAETGLVMLLEQGDLEGVKGSVSEFERILRAALGRAGR